MNDSASSPGSARLPLVVQLAFAGLRFLIETAAHPGVDAAGFEAAVARWLTERLRRLSEEPGLGPRPFVCGLSSLALGGGLAFPRACETRGWPQGLLLPQPREDFLAARAAEGAPDFRRPPAQRPPRCSPARASSRSAWSEGRRTGRRASRP